MTVTITSIAARTARMVTQMILLSSNQSSRLSTQADCFILLVVSSFSSLQQENYQWFVNHVLHRPACVPTWVARVQHAKRNCDKAINNLVPAVFWLALTVRGWVDNYTRYGPVWPSPRPTLAWWARNWDQNRTTQFPTKLWSSWRVVLTPSPAPPTTYQSSNARCQINGLVSGEKNTPQDLLVWLWQWHYDKSWSSRYDFVFSFTDSLFSD